MLPADYGGARGKDWGVGVGWGWGRREREREREGGKREGMVGHLALNH